MSENKKINIQFEESDSQANGLSESDSQSGSEMDSETKKDAQLQDQEASSESQSDPIRQMEAKIEDLEKEVEANYDRFVRVTADFENYKKRTTREMSELRKYANEAILKDMLSVVDNLERAIESGQKQDSEKQTILDGVKITLKDLSRIFEKYGVKEFKSEGEPFDPVFHQAMMQEQTSNYPDNTVLNELQKGYTIHERLLRPAMVVVARNTSENEGDETDESN